MLLIPAEGVKPTAGAVCELLRGKKGGVTPAGRAQAGAPLVFDGNGLNCEKVRDVACEGRLVAVGPAGLRRARRACAVVRRAMASRPATSAVEEHALAGRHLLVLAQPGVRPRGLGVRHGLDDDGGQHGRRRMRVEDQAGADAGGQQDIGITSERDKLHVGEDSGAHAEAPREPERLDRLGRPGRPARVPRQRMAGRRTQISSTATAATVIAVTWPTAATSRRVRPAKIRPTKISTARSAAAATRAGQEPSASATTIADTTT